MWGLSMRDLKTEKSKTFPAQRVVVQDVTEMVFRSSHIGPIIELVTARKIGISEQGTDQTPYLESHRVVAMHKLFLEKNLQKGNGGRP